VVKCAYLDQVDIPDPVKDDEGVCSVRKWQQQDCPPATACRLAVRRFTGFCTAGEIARQKESLLAALPFDQVELTGTASRTAKP
jgi:hypothetical protein